MAAVGGSNEVAGARRNSSDDQPPAVSRALGSTATTTGPHSGHSHRHASTSLTQPSRMGARMGRMSSTATSAKSSAVKSDPHASSGPSSSRVEHSHVASYTITDTVKGEQTQPAPAPALDFSSLRTFVPRHPNPPPRPQALGQRLFGISHAPVYHPTIAQFADPTAYIESIAPEASKFGICKVVPPQGWRPGFALNTQTFRFKTRMQQLNMMEGSARANLNFLEQLMMYHKQYNAVDISIPIIGGKPVDVLRLRRLVKSLGGYAEVTLHRKWTHIAKTLNILNPTTVTAMLKSAYVKLILPYDEYVERVKAAGGTPPPDPRIINYETPKPKDHFGTHPLSDGTETLPTPQSDAGGPIHEKVEASNEVRTASDKLNDALKAPASRMSGVKLKPALDSTPGEVCELCAEDHSPEKIVLCDDCDRGFHLDCLNPPLVEVPDEQFFCDQCIISNGADYGFEEGNEHSLHSFRTFADAFKRQWLIDHPLPRDQAGRPRSPPRTDEEIWAEQLEIEDHFEREFWRLVNEQKETVEVEYGADLTSSTDGGGMPSLESHPSDPYSDDKWNLNNLPVVDGSLLRFISADVSGMTVPWIYVGMVFSTFAWHKEDHYTYSINYHHWGDTKTWYGIPGDQDEKLEAAMRQAAPELFEQNADLMFQLVTLMSPGQLKKKGVTTYACDQRPNEFVITFPKAYHSGFNHGFNFNEAVNFALPDWLPNGLKCVKTYREIKKNPVFSHDELLVAISAADPRPTTAKWLVPNFTEMVEREFDRRASVRERFPAIKETIDASPLNEEDYQCRQCKTLSFLSRFVSRGPSKTVACPDDVGSLPQDESHSFLLRFTDDQLKQMLNDLVTLSESASASLVGDYVVPIHGESSETRSTGRKRKPSAAAREAGYGTIEDEGEERISFSHKVARRRSDELSQMAAQYGLAYV